MKHALLYPLLLSVTLCCCKLKNKTTSPPSTIDTNNVVIDSSIRDTVARYIQFTSDRNFSYFKTPIEVRFISNDQVVDSIIQPDFNMTSWYYFNQDTVDLVAHIGELETSAMLLRFINGRPNVFFYRAPHLEQRIFKIKTTDSFSNQIEVPPLRYKLKLSNIPDSVNKAVVFGCIDMESSDYYNKRDSTEVRHRIQMKFYFRSQNRKFE